MRGKLRRQNRRKRQETTNELDYSTWVGRQHRQRPARLEGRAAGERGAERVQDVLLRARDQRGRQVVESRGGAERAELHRSGRGHEGREAC